MREVLEVAADAVVVVGALVAAVSVFYTGLRSAWSRVGPALTRYGPTGLAVALIIASVATSISVWAFVSEELHALNGSLSSVSDRLRTLENRVGGDRVGGNRSDPSAQAAFATRIRAGDTSVQLNAGRGAMLELEVDPDRYRIDALPTDENLDPVLHLYRAWQGAFDEVARDDDGGEMEFAARIEADIGMGRYYLQVEDFLAAAGEIDLEIRPEEVETR